MSVFRSLRTAWRRLTGKVSRVPDYFSEFQRRIALPRENVEFPQAYRVVPAVYFCVSLIVERLSAIPLRFYTQRSAEAEKQYLEDRPGTVQYMWNRANSEETGLDLMQQLVGCRQIHGTAYLFLDFMKTQTVQELWMLHPLGVELVKGAGRRIDHYRVRDGSKWVEVPKQQIVPFPRFDPDLQRAGLSPLMALRIRYETIHDSARLQRQFYAKGGMSPGYFSTDMGIDEDTNERLKKEFDYRHQGVHNAFAPVFLPKSLKYERAGLTFEEMEHAESYKVNLGDILLGYKIPAFFANLAEGTGMNSDVARVAEQMLHLNAIDPECRAIAATLNEHFLTLPGIAGVGQEIKCEFDYSKVLAVVWMWLAQAEAYQKACGAPFMTRAEVRERLSLKRLSEPSLDELLEPAAMLTAGEDREVAVDTDPSKPAGPRSDEDERKRSDRSHDASTTRDHRDQKRVRADRSLRMHERRMGRGFRRVFERQRVRTKARARDQFEDRSFTNEVADSLGLRARPRVIDVNDLLRDDDFDITIIRRITRAIVQDQGEAALAELGLELAFEVDRRDRRAWIQEKAAKAISGTSATTRERLRNEIPAEGTLDEVIAAIDRVFDKRRENVATIARTETAPAFNYGTVEAWGDSEMVGEKEWLTAQDDHVRPHHVEADGQVVRLEDAFSVDGERLDFPGDPSGSADNIINCRCTMLPVVGSRKRVEVPGPIAARLNGNGKHAQSLEEWLSAVK